MYIQYITSSNLISFLGTCNGCNMGMGDFPNTYVCPGPGATGPRAEGIHIRQITNGHVTSVMYSFVPIVTTPVVLIPQVIVTLVCKVIRTNCYCLIVKDLSTYIQLLYSGNTLYMKPCE